MATDVYRLQWLYGARSYFMTLLEETKFAPAQFEKIMFRQADRDSQVVSALCYLPDKKEVHKVLFQSTRYYHRVRLCVERVKANDAKVECFLQEDPPADTESER